MKKRIANVLLTAAVLLSVFALVAIAAPGSEDDPLISKSYLDEVMLPDIYAYIDEAMSPTNTDGTGETTAYEVVNVSADKKVYLEKGAEVILRMGTATTIASRRGGLADVTAGYDLPDGSNVPPNHELIAPLSDGRGVCIGDSDAILMIKGKYRIE